MHETRDGKNAIRFSITVAAVCIMLLDAISPTCAEDDPHLGMIEYEISCMGCHGLNGRGNGPHARGLKTTPADLTQIKRRNKGTFPYQAIVALIDGRSIDEAHGEREMPVWGIRYRTGAATNQPADWIDKRVREQIAALARYVETLQED